MRFSVAFPMVSVVQSEIILRVVAGIYLMIRRILVMPMMRRKKRLLLAALVMWLAIEPLDVQCQVQKALDDSATMVWLSGLLEKGIADGKDSILEDEYIRKMLIERGRSPIGKRMIQIGPREIQVERFFWTVSAMRNRFAKEPKRSLQWNLIMTDLIVIGRVLSVTREEKLCAYGTQVAIEVDRYLKGTGLNTVYVKLVRGRKVSERSVIVSSGEPKFEVGEEVLLHLSATPIVGHDMAVVYSMSNCTGFFYVTNTGGDYYEVAGVDDAKRTIVDGKLKWRGKTCTLEEVESSILTDLQTTF